MRFQFLTVSMAEIDVIWPLLSTWVNLMTTFPILIQKSKSPYSHWRFERSNHFCINIPDHTTWCISSCSILFFYILCVASLTTIKFIVLFTLKFLISLECAFKNCLSIFLDICVWNLKIYRSTNVFRNPSKNYDWAFLRKFFLLLLAIFAKVSSLILDRVLNMPLMSTICNSEILRKSLQLLYSKLMF